MKFEKKDGHYSCPICQKSFTRIDSVRQHLGTHVETLAHKCDQCDQTFGWASTLRRHKQKFHGHPQAPPLSVQCDHCQRIFKSRVHCKVHMGQFSHQHLSLIDWPQDGQRSCYNYWLNSALMICYQLFVLV